MINTSKDRHRGGTKTEGRYTQRKQAAKQRGSREKKRDKETHPVGAGGNHVYKMVRGGTAAADGAGTGASGAADTREPSSTWTTGPPQDRGKCTVLPSPSTGPTANGKNTQECRAKK
ncbi:unnamed protein product, partial [Pylaiella littoralis]